jgi:CRP-like cAMP-binding protein
MTDNLAESGGRLLKKAHQSFYERAGAAAVEGTRGAALGARVPVPVRGADTFGPSALGGLLTNRLLRALPAEDAERLLSALEPVSLSSRENLSDMGQRHVFFPEDAVVSHLVVFEDGGTVEAAMTGRDGVVSLSAIFGRQAPTHWSRVTVPGSALRLKADIFRQEFHACESFRNMMLGHAARHSAQVAQRGACVSRHRVENRLATWLLMLHDRAGSDELPLTQELIARRIGTRRAGISECAGKFQERGFISYSRGALRIRDRRELEGAACECYALIREHGS